LPMPAALPSYHDTVRAEWVDYNGHMRDASYMLIFSFATDALIDLIGLPDAERKKRDRSIFTLEAHVNYLREIKQGAQVRIDTRVLGHDTKRLHLYLEMFSGNEAEPVAASEQMLLHVDTRGPRSIAFDPDIEAQVRALADAHSAWPPARYTGHVIGLPANVERNWSGHA
jgi:acyl-CoA thioester hydrolase